MNKILSLFILFQIGYSVALVAQINQSIEQSFKVPPANTRPTVWWRWYGRQISKEGITRDLEAMKKAGIGGFYHFQLKPGVQDIINDPQNVLPNVATLSKEWWDLIQFSILEADRLGLEATFHNSLGWSSSGGTWIQPEQSMQKLVWIDTTIIGGIFTDIKLNKPQVDPKWNYYKDVAVIAIILDESGVVSKDNVKDISSSINKEGILKWDAPKGNWKIIRYGHTTTGKMPVQASPEVAGIECDKLDSNALKIHFNNYPGKILNDAGKLAGKSLKYIAVDSYEAGLQNWNHQFRDQFLKRRGYDPIIWLPVITGVQVENYDPRSKSLSPSIIIENKEMSERFIFDFERTISELIMEQYYGALGNLVHQYPGVELEVQSYNAPMNLVENAVKNEMPAGEFWHNNKVYGWWTLNLAASAAHISGKKIVSAESFTAEPQHGNWSISPEDLKAEADLAFSKGINRMELHIQPHQPWLDKAIPGMIGGSYGLQINPANTYWKQSLSWNIYISRCQYMLRQGQFVGDICYLYPKKQRGFTVPLGYNGDAIDEESLIKLMYVKEGKLCLPSGMQYRMLVLTNTAIMSLSLAKKIQLLIEEGAIVLGPKPQRTPGLENYLEQDKQVSEIGNKIWGDLDGTQKKFRRYGKGMIFLGMKPEEVLQEMKVEKDFELIGSSSQTSFAWIHRSIGKDDLYFVANQERKTQIVTIGFRVAGKIPEIWNAETGEKIQDVQWKQEGNRIFVNISFESLQSWFVVFKNVDTNTKFAFKESSNNTNYTAIDLSKDWEIDFHGVQNTPSKFEIPQLKSWTNFDSKAINYFSGTATYTKSFSLLASQINESSKMILVLGMVKNFADVFVNGKEIANLWKQPFVLDITQYLKTGSNFIRIDVTNLWANRMIGDEQEPADMEWTKESFSSDSLFRGRELIKYPEWFLHGKQRPSVGRYTFSTWNYYRKSDPLLISGLMGPVYLKLVKK